MKILVDMNLSPDWVPILQASGFEAVHWSSVGDPRSPDRAIMTWAATNGYTVFTHDLDFGALLAATQAECPSVIQIRAQNILTDYLSDLAIKVLRQFSSELEIGALITIDETRTRVRLLPLRQRYDEEKRSP